MIRLVATTAMLLSGLVGPVIATDTKEINAVTEKITEFVAGISIGEVQASSVADEQIIAYSSGGMWEYLSGAEFIASLTEGPRLVVKSYHINVRLLGDAKDIAYASYYLGGKITQDGEVIVVDYRTRISQVLQKDGNNWVIVATHASALFGGSGVPAD